MPWGWSGEKTHCFIVMMVLMTKCQRVSWQYYIVLMMRLKTLFDVIKQNVLFVEQTYYFKFSITYHFTIQVQFYCGVFKTIFSGGLECGDLSDWNHPKKHIILYLQGCFSLKAPLNTLFISFTFSSSVFFSFPYFAFFPFSCWISISVFTLHHCHSFVYQVASPLHCATPPGYKADFLK